MIEKTAYIRITAGVDVKAKCRQRVLRYLLNRIIIELLIASGSWICDLGGCFFSGCMLIFWSRL